MDSSRKIDLQELHDARKTAPSKYQKVIDNSIKNIMNESPSVSRDRERLVNAVRSGDQRGVNQLRQQIDNQTRNEHGGKYGW
jgi:hypothetical protein